MTQPFDCDSAIPALREIDREAGEFWVPNPWDFSTRRENLSAYEPNGVFLNLDGTRFADIGFLSNADSRGDGRAAAACDITGDGMPELFVRQVGGGPLLVYRNRFPQANWLTVSLEGTRSNRAGIGARMACTAGGRTVRRELYPVISFLSQTPPQVTFGLGKVDRIDKLEIRWPSGQVDVLNDLPINRHVRVREGEGRILPPRTPGTSATRNLDPEADPEFEIKMSRTER